MDKLNQLMDYLSEYFAHRKGLLPLIGIFFVGMNFIFQLIPGLGFLATSNLLLHLGIVIAILGLMLAWTL